MIDISTKIISCASTSVLPSLSTIESMRFYSRYSLWTLTFRFASIRSEMKFNVYKGELIAILHIVSTFLVYLHFPKTGRRLRKGTEIKQVVVGWRTRTLADVYIYRRKKVATLPRCCIYAGRRVSLARCSLKVVDSYRTADEAKVKSDSKRTERESLFSPLAFICLKFSRASETIYTHRVNTYILYTCLLGILWEREREASTSCKRAQWHSYNFGSAFWLHHPIYRHANI